MRKEKGREGWEGWSGRGRKEEGGLDFDICPGAPDFLVTSLIQVRLYFFNYV